jgi:Phosphotransferase enzyme family
MIEGLLNRWMGGETGLEELGMSLREVGGNKARVLSVRQLEKHVYGIAIATPRQRLEIVAKRLTPPLANRNQLVMERWLPAAGLEYIAPKLLGVAAERAGRAVWHLYEDLGRSNLEDSPSTRHEVHVAIEMVADLHARFAGDHILAECWMWGEDHGMAFYDHSVRHAIAAVSDAVSALGTRGSDSDAARALLEKLERLADERDYRANKMAEFGGPDTLLHGDLWLDNLIVLSGSRARNGLAARGSAVCLIDWDNVGPGSFAYDLSTLVLRFPAEEQATVVSLYRAAAAANGIDVPADEDLHVPFATAESARLASIAIWPALTVADQGSQWASERLAEINEWFDLPRPLSAPGKRAEPLAGDPR